VAAASSPSPSPCVSCSETLSPVPVTVARTPTRRPPLPVRVTHWQSFRVSSSGSASRTHQIRCSGSPAPVAASQRPVLPCSGPRYLTAARAAAPRPALPRRGPRCLAAACRLPRRAPRCLAAPSTAYILGADFGNLPVAVGSHVYKQTFRLHSRGRLFKDRNRTSSPSKLDFVVVRA
jgi:hypothetical protein